MQYRLQNKLKYYNYENGSLLTLLYNSAVGLILKPFDERVFT